MVDGYYQKLIRILRKDAGAVQVKGGKGSHERWNTDTGVPLTVPHNCYSRHTANKILQDAGLDKRF